MAQNVTIAGASYTDVPAVDISKTGGGTAKFVDTSDANAAASDILSGKTAYVDGSKVTGTATLGTPIEVSTDAGMEAVLTAANVGKAYQFTGITGTYTNGDIYVVEEGS